MDDKFAGARVAGGAVGLTLYGITLNEWVAILTCTYFLIQIVILMPKFIKTVAGWITAVKERFDR